MSFKANGFAHERNNSTHTYTRHAYTLIHGNWGARAHTHTYANTHTCTHTFTQAHAHAHARTHTHTHTHVHMQTHNTREKTNSR